MELKLGRNILSQVCEEIPRDEDFNDIEIKINGRLVKNPLYLIEKYNEALENGISNFDNEVEECAKKLIVEKYDDILQESMQLSRQLEDLKSTISFKIDYYEEEV